MSEYKVLYQIKTLEKMILRKFLNSNNMEMPRCSLSPTQMQIIEYMLEHIDEDIYQRDLEEVLNLRRATVSGVLQTMEKNHLINRVTNSQDTRIKKIMLNEDTKNIFMSNKDKLEQMEKQVIDNISENELKVFSKVIEKMKANIDKI